MNEDLNSCPAPGAKAQVEKLSVAGDDQAHVVANSGERAIGPDAESAAGARAMSALSQAITAPRARGDQGHADSEGPAAQKDEDEDEDERRDLLDCRICAFDPYSTRIVAALHPGGWLYEELKAQRQGTSLRGRWEGRRNNLEALAEAADALLADKHAARQSSRKGRR